MVSQVESILLGRDVASPVARGLLRRVLAVDVLEDQLREVLAAGGGRLCFDVVLSRIRVTVECSDVELEQIPATGPVVVAANHPFGLLEGPVLGSVLARRRSDIKFLANRALAVADALRSYVIPVDTASGGAAVRSNWRALREGLRWLEHGGLLVVLPAGEVAALRLAPFGVREPAWSEAVGWLIHRSGAAAFSVFVEGTNSPAFHLAGLLHPRLRTALLPREFLNKRGRRVRLVIGPLVAAERLRQMTPREATEYLRSCTELLGEARRRRPAAAHTGKPRRLKPVAPRLPAASLEEEIRALPPESLLVESGNQRVHLAQAGQIPRVLRELGVLREMTFRQAGEGTGRAVDLDAFDQHYLHLFIWHTERREIVGAYRLCSEEAAERLYTGTLFHIRNEFFERIRPAVELGRSFIQPAFQKSYSGLFLLWRGIGEFLNRHPHYRYLFGPVSISAAYSPISRSLITAFLRRRFAHSSLADLVRPARQVRPAWRSQVWLERLVREVRDIEELSRIVAALEPDGKGLPVLLRQYLQLGAQVVEFSLDRAFSNVIDGLIVVDLLAVEPATLARYLGRSGAARYLAHHGRQAQAETRSGNQPSRAAPGRPA